MKKISKYNLGLLVIHSIDILLILLMALGVFGGMNGNMVPLIFVCAFLVMPTILMYAKWEDVKENGEDIKFEIVPFVAFAVLEIIFGIKMTLQLEDAGVYMGAISMIVFVLVIASIACIYVEKCNNLKKKMIAYLCMLGSHLLFTGVYFVLILDWWFVDGIL